MMYCLVYYYGNVQLLCVRQQVEKQYAIDTLGLKFRVLSHYYSFEHSIARKILSIGIYQRTKENMFHQ